MPTFLVVSRHPPENCPMNNEDEETDAGVAENNLFSVARNLNNCSIYDENGGEK